MKAYTVKVPAQWAGINSARAQTYLREFFIHPLTLPADPGAGERLLRLTLAERQVDALSRGSGDVPAVALRRLLSARIRELPAGEPKRYAVEREGIVSARATMPELERKSRTVQLLEIPSWFDAANPNRESYWRSLGVDCQLGMIESHRVFEGKDRGEAMNTQKKTARQFSALERAIWWVGDHWGLLFLVGVLLIFLGRRWGWFATAVTGTASTAEFPAWRPS